MKIHEYQGKDLFRRYGIAVPTGGPCLSIEEADARIDSLPAAGIWVIKAQIHAGGRGKGGGVHIAKTPQEAKEAARRLLGMTLTTHQTGPEGQTVRRLLIEEGARIADELYCALVVDRSRQQIVVMASSEGGMDIETVAAETPEKVKKLWLDESAPPAAVRQMAKEIGIPETATDDAVDLIHKLHRLFRETDASLVEINPLVVTEENRLLALDAKINFDDNALYRHPELVELTDPDEEDPIEWQAAQQDLSYISLTGDIGCMVNGAGLAMATMDIIKLYGGEPANFLDVGGGATTEKVTAAFQIMLTNRDIKAILVNIFGGIMRCDIIAEGIVEAARQTALSVPLIVRLQGTNAEEGKAILAASGMSIIAADSMSDAAEKSVNATKAV